MTTVTVLALASGIAATSLAFVVLNAFFLRPLPVRDSDRIVRIYTSYSQGIEHFTVSYPDFSDIRNLTTVFAGVFAEEPVPFSLVASGVPERIYGELVAGGYFSVLGVRPAAGRLFTPVEEDAPQPDCLAVVGYDVWHRRFGGDRSVVGKRLLLNGDPCEVIGVAPRGFNGITSGVRPEIWRPARRGRITDRGGRRFFVGARLQPGVSVAQARAAVDLLARRLQQQYPSTNSGIGFPVLAEAESRIHPLVRGGVAGLSGALVAVGGGVLLLACANVAGIMLIAALGRRREIGVRFAIGASRPRLVRQLLTEAAVLAFAAGGIGIALAWTATKLLGSIDLPTRIPVFFDFRLDGRVLALSAITIATTTLLFGLAPALQATQLDLTAMLRSAGVGGFRPSRLRTGLIALQVALAMVLLMTGGVFLRSLINAERIDLGFDPRGVVTASVDPGLHGYSNDAIGRFWRRLIPRLESLAHVESVSLASSVPFELNITRVSVGPEGYQPSATAGWPSVDCAAVDTGYFATLRIRFLEGRDFAASDREASPGVAIINEELARRFWPGSVASGRRLITPSGDMFHVIGVVRGNRFLTLGESPRPQIYFPFHQGSAAGTIVVRTSGDPRSTLADVRAAVGALDSTLPLHNVSTMEEHVRVALLPALASAVTATTVAVIALLLIGLGLYGSVTQVVRGREHEIGVRSALGARPRDVLWVVLRQTVGIVALGSVAGLGAGLVATRALRAFAYGVGADDPIVIAIAPLALVSLCATVAFIPALAALRIDTARALRSE